MRYHVQVATTGILHRELNDLAARLQRAIEGAGVISNPTVTGQMLTRRLVMSAYVDSDDAEAAMDSATTVLLRHLRSHGPEYRGVGIHHADATPVG